MVGPSCYVLSSQDGSHVSIDQQVDDEVSCFIVRYTQRMTAEMAEASNTKSPYKRPRNIAMTKTFSDAVHAADTFASQRFPWKFIHTAQSWRRSLATESQLMFLNKLRPMRKQLTSESISKGKAADMITKVKFGAKGWFRELEASKRKDARHEEQAQRLETLRKREEVRLGPLTH